MSESVYRWVGAHAYRDHANDRVVERGEELPEDIAERVAAAHPHDVDVVEVDDVPGWSEEAWLDGDYTERADAVADGRVDAHLDAIEDAETSETVIEAVEERREELA